MKISLTVIAIVAMLLHSPFANSQIIDELENHPRNTSSSWVAKARGIDGVPDKGNVVIGVDSLGRFAVAVDSFHHALAADGLVDHYFLFTGSERLAGPWSLRLDDVSIIHTSHTLVILSKRPAIAVELAVASVNQSSIFNGKRKQPGRLLSVLDGRELVSRGSADGSGQMILDSIDHTRIDTWPRSFWMDILDPGTAQTCGNEPDDGCQAGGNGGFGATSCAVECSGADCSVGCTGQCIDYACCNCNGIFVSTCRCKTCQNFPLCAP